MEADTSRKGALTTEALIKKHCNNTTDTSVKQQEVHGFKQSRLSKIFFLITLYNFTQ